MARKAPGVYSTVVNIGTNVNSKQENITFILGKASTGPLVPTEIFSAAEAEKIFGPELDDDFGLVALNKIIPHANSVFYVRIAHVGDKVAFGKDSNIVFEAKEGGIFLNDATLDIAVVEDVITITLKKDDAVLEEIQVSKDPLSADFIDDVFTDKSEFLALAAGTAADVVAGTLEVLRQGTEGAKEAQAEATDALEAVALYKGDFLNTAILKISTTVDGRIGANLIRNGVVLEQIPVGAQPESAKDFVDRFNTASQYVKITNYPAVKSVSAIFRDGDAGNDDVIPSDYVGDLTTGLKGISDKAQFQITTLIIPGVHDPAVLDAAQSLARNRQDFVFIADPPIGLRAYQTRAWVDASGSFVSSTRLDSDHVAVFTPWCKDSNNNGVKMFMPPSIFVAAQLAKNDQTYNVWDAPAGYTRGVIEDIDDIEYYPSTDDRNVLYTNSVINPIIYVKDKGFVIFGNKTCRRAKYPNTPECTCSLNVVRLVNHVKFVIENIAMGLVFEINDSHTWDNFKLQVEPILRAIKQARGLYDYQVVMDETTVTAEMIDSLCMPGIIKLKPSRTAEVIELSFELYPASVSFNQDGERLD